MPNQVDGALLRAPCPVPSCPACEPNTGSVHPNLPAKTARVEASRHCYAIKWLLVLRPLAGCHTARDHRLPALRHLDVLNDYRLLSASSQFLQGEKSLLVYLHHACGSI